MSDITLRRASAEDAQVVAEIGAETFQLTFGHLYAPRDLTAFLARSHGVARALADLADPAQAVWLAEQGGAAVGYALAGPCALPHDEVTAQCGELKRIYLHPAAQGAGVGGRLFNTAIDWLQRGGSRDVWIGVWSENFGAQRFYARAGFEKVGEYGFQVGTSIDREFILRRRAESFSNIARGAA
ncbi:GNAT family N-acetyltransferase [Phenylobacterium immobile]|uniref:GNAT family N-acetyltransferase n=1 Tax=Phenylobacterium immobile TaxID=21 RepID=UPI000B27EB4E|nr:GNAT family N-acetyltransferase [Phenylobacterium immobile]